MNYFEYLKTAFFTRWNLLFVGAAGALGLISGRPDVVWPLAIAAEIGYLGLLASHPRFQQAVDARRAGAMREKTKQTNQASLERIMRTLPRHAMERFAALRSRCLELRQLALEMRGPIGSMGEQPFEQAQTESLDRLLWVFLRLLFTQHALNRFLHKTSVQEIEQDVARIEQRLKQLEGDDPQKLRLRRTLEDNLAASRERLANVRKAQDNLQLIELQIEQVENRIRAVSELAVNRHEPEFITSQVEFVADSMKQTEETLNELRFATGLDLAEEAPPLLRPLSAKVIE